MRLLVVRHGESICGVNGIVGGAKGCTGLTGRGFAQARALRDRLAREALLADVLLSSTLPRAFETAEVLSDVLGPMVARDADLCEFVPGEIDGKPWGAWERFDVRAEPDRPMSPGGESLTTFRSRVRRVLDRLASQHDRRTVLAVCHGGIAFMSRELLIGNHEPADVDFTSITEWSCVDGAWTLVRYNDVAHLEGSDLLPARAEVT